MTLERRVNEELKILVVDDEKIIRLSMSARLRKAGYTPVAFAGVSEALKAFQEDPTSYAAIITDIVMDDMDGFAFRDLVRSIYPVLPFFFLTAMDPEEGSGFLMRILDDPLSYYLPKAVKSDVLLRRISQVVASRRISRFVEQKMEDDRKSLQLAANIQKSLLPERTWMDSRCFCTTWWNPLDTVSGDLYESHYLGDGYYLLILGDIQGHGISAALAMTAVQSFLKRVTYTDVPSKIKPTELANLLQKFFRSNLADISYMTALICIFNVEALEVKWISCGAPDLVVLDGGRKIPANPTHKGGLPIGLMPDTVYGEDDVVLTKVTPTAVCVGHTDGIYDLSSDTEGADIISKVFLNSICIDIADASRKDGSLLSAAAKFMHVCEESDYTHQHDDVTLLVFGAKHTPDGMYEDVVKVNPESIDIASQKMADWCRERGWDVAAVSLVQVVFEEKLMNVHDHGFDARDRFHEVVGFRLRERRGEAELTIWDYGRSEPSMHVAAGDASTAFALANKDLNNHGRGRLMVRSICSNVERLRYGDLNETTYRIGGI